MPLRLHMPAFRFLLPLVKYSQQLSNKLLFGPNKGASELTLTRGPKHNFQTQHPRLGMPAQAASDSGGLLCSSSSFHVAKLSSLLKLLRFRCFCDCSVNGRCILVGGTGMSHVPPSRDFGESTMVSAWYPHQNDAYSIQAAGAYSYFASSMSCPRPMQADVACIFSNGQDLGSRPAVASSVCVNTSPDSKSKDASQKPVFLRKSLPHCPQRHTSWRYLALRSQLASQRSQHARRNTRAPLKQGCTSVRRCHGPSSDIPPGE